MEEETKINLDHVDSEYIIAYYQHQYDRMAKFDDQSMTITNIAITLSILAFTFAYDSAQTANLQNAVILPLLIFFSNFFAIGYMQRSRYWIRAHRQRANEVIKIKAGELYKINKKYSPPPTTKNFPFVGNRDLKALLHLIIMAGAMVPIITYYNKPNWAIGVVIIILLAFFLFVIRPKDKDKEKKVKPLKNKIQQTR